MENGTLRLYPLPAEERPLKGLYLSHNLRQYTQNTSKTFVYTNYVTSLDGRIAIPHPTRVKHLRWRLGLALARHDSH